jgi:undecaprenyl-diphosphatase
MMGLLQGLTEWLPVSSSGHLVLAQHLFGVTDRTLFDAILHLGTLFAMMAYFRTDVKPFLNLKNPGTHKIILASIPIIVVGFILRDYIEAAFASVVVVSILLIINGSMLMIHLFLKQDEKANNNKNKEKINEPDPKKIEDLSMKNVVYIGLFHIFALFPGISRSGTTITTGRVLGLDWATAAKFAFFISFLPIAGAAWFKILTDWQEFQLVYILGFIVAFLVGYATIDLMMRVLRKGKFHYFGVYTIVLGIIILISIFI